MTDRTERREPCGNCPFRRSAPLAHWAPDHYVMLRDIQRDERDFGYSLIFACHKDDGRPSSDQGLCVGWMLDQRRRGVPSLALRMELAIGEDADALAVQLEKINGDADCYETVEDLVRVNLVRDRELHPLRYEEDEDTIQERR